MPDIRQILLSTDADIIVQEVVEQSPSTARFNPSSLNTFRITSLNINGRTSICSRTLKMGAPGNIVDNIGGAGGGLMAGVSAEGLSILSDQPPPALLPTPIMVSDLAE